jgi:DNA-directed RNA polymerase II subunit RPB2
MERRNIDMRALERTEDENFDITAEIQSKLDKLTVNDLPYPQEIIKVSNAITSNTDTAGEIKVGPEGKLLQEFLQFDGLTKQIIDAFDYWLEVILPRRIVTTVIPFALGKITFSDVLIKPPQYMDTEAGKERKMFPLYARRNKVTYAVSVYVNIAFYAKDNTSDKPNQSDDVKIAEIPVMLGSKYCNLRGLNEKELLSIGECALDPYGYFIIEGQEKIVLQHDKLRFNKPFIFPKENKNRNKEAGIFEEYVNLNSKKQEFSSFICRFTAMPNLDSERFSEQKEFLPTIQYDAKKSTVVNMLFDKKAKTIVIQLDRFPPDTYLNIFSIYELYGVNFENSESGLLKPILMIINYIKEENKSQIITFLNKAFIVYREERKTLIDSLKNVMKLPQEIENDTSERQIKFYQERIGEVLFKQTEGVIYADDKQRKYDAKLQMLSIMVARFAEYNSNLRSLDDRDSWSNKRIVSAGPAIEHLFNQIWNFLVVESLIKGSLINVTINEPNFILNNTINKIPGSFVKDNFVRSFGPNTWGVQQSIMKENMTDFLKNETLLAKYSQILRISPETSDKGKQTSIREVHPTQLGYICPIETPEGKQCGIVKSLAVGCYVSIGRDEGLIYNFIVSSNLLYLDQSASYNTALILNGKFIGWCDGSRTQIVLRDARRRESIYRDTLIYFEKPRTLWIYCDGGRPTRPLLIVDQKTGRLVIEMKNMWNSSFPELLREGCVEYIDALEQEECVVAQSIWDPVFKLIETRNMGSMLAEKYRNPTAQRDPTLFDSFREIITDPKYTHCEMDPNAILSLVASIIPMPDRSQAPRNTYQTSMGKQALSIQNTNAINRFDVEVKSLAYPSRAIFETQMYKYIGLDQLPIGETVMVAMMSYLGYNQEDAIIINQESVDLGLFRIVRTLTYKTIQISDKDFTEVIQKPKKAKNMDMLDKDGVILPGSFVRPDDCLIGKVKKYHGTNEVVDASVYVGMGDTGIVERVLKTTSSDSRRIVLVKIREVRKPLAGDKCACYGSETEILTQNRGWITIKDVKTEDKVASLENGILRYVHPETTMEYDYEGEMYNLKSNQVDLFVTPNHNLYVKERTSNEHKLIRADRVFGKRVNHKKNAENDKPDQEFFNLPACVYQYKKKTVDAPERQIPMNAWLKLFGIWMAEGYANAKHIKICGHKERVRKVLDEIESDIGVPFSRCVDKRFDNELNTIYYILDRQFCDYLTKLSVGAVNKSLPEWCFELSKTQSQILLDSMVLGDGCVSKNNCVKYYTSSKKLADDVQVLALHSGWSANIKKRYEAGHSVWYEARQENITATADAFDITIVKKKNEPQINHGHKKTQNGQKEEWVPYSGKVYCVTVPSGVIYIRHNMKPVWCGNSRYAQKGTIGIVLPKADMPQINTGPNAGMTPDLIINPHSIPSRMTIGKMIEIMTSKVAAMKGEKINATAFRPFDLDEYSNSLASFGFDRYGKETMINGMLGHEFNTKIFVGPCYYQALKHHVVNKIQQRARGAIKATTRQPTAGRTKGGGIRLGEMERDALISHGATSCQKEKTFDHSDPFKTLFCVNCGKIADVKKNNLGNVCGTCNQAKYGLVSIPYSTKVLLHELGAASITINFKLAEKKKTGFTKK